MLDILLSNSLWGILIAVDIILSIELSLNFKKDHDLRKVMFVFGLLFVMQTYFIAIVGNSTIVAQRIFQWCTLPILTAFVITLLNTIFKINLKKCFYVFVGIMAATISLFIIPQSISSMPFLLTGLFFALILAAIQLRKEFDPSGTCLALSFPSFAVCYLSISYNMMELGIFSAFIAKIFLIFSFELAKRQTGPVASFLVLQKELIQIKEDLTQTQEKLLQTEKLAAIGKLSTILAHDLRNPLQSIKSGIFSLKKTSEVKENSKILNLLNHMDEAVNYSEKIAKSLLEYSEPLHLDIRETSPQSVISKAISSINIPSNIQVINQTSPSLIYLDAEKIIRASKKVIENAIDAMPYGGTLRINSNESTELITFNFQDNGAGIAKENVAQLWEPLHTTKAKGMGLGLAICKRIVEAHNGTVNLKSEIGKGTIVSFTLPKKQDTIASKMFQVNPDAIISDNYQRIA